MRCLAVAPGPQQAGYARVGYGNFRSVIQGKYTFVKSSPNLDAVWQAIAAGPTRIPKCSRRRTCSRWSV
jgi:hypothetical protein